MTRTCQVVKALPSLEATILLTSPFKAGDGNEDYLCGSCGSLVVSGFDLTRPHKYFANKFGFFITCSECTAYNQVVRPRVS
ncbi:MAG: hypothetical protein ABSF08_11775 [Candidatus Cybelea sp.]|jgi:hypothetical protein